MVILLQLLSSVLFVMNFQLGAINFPNALAVCLFSCIFIYFNYFSDSSLVSIGQLLGYVLFLVVVNSLGASFTFFYDNCLTFLWVTSTSIDGNLKGTVLGLYVPF